MEKSKQNNGWVLTGDRRFNVPFLYHVNWREAPLVANDQQIRIGEIYSSPLAVNRVVYFGSSDGFLYALEYASVLSRARASATPAHLSFRAKSRNLSM
jgi:hypothetical protein